MIFMADFALWSLRSNHRRGYEEIFYSFLNRWAAAECVHNSPLNNTFLMEIRQLSVRVSILGVYELSPHNAFRTNEGASTLRTRACLITDTITSAVTVLGALRLAEYVTFSDCKNNYFLSE